MIAAYDPARANAASGRLNPIGTATPHQRQYARILMRELDLDTRAFTRAHDRFYRIAGIPTPEHGKSVDDGLCALDRKQISALLQALKNETEK